MNVTFSVFLYNLIKPQSWRFSWFSPFRPVSIRFFKKDQLTYHVVLFFLRSTMMIFLKTITLTVLSVCLMPETHSFYHVDISAYATVVVSTIGKKQLFDLSQFVLKTIT